MRRLTGVFAVIALTVGVLSGTPANATHITASKCSSTSQNPSNNAACAPAGISLLEGQGYVCAKADVPLSQKRCVYHTDEFWTDQAAVNDYNATVRADNGQPCSSFNGTTCVLKNPQFQGLGAPSRHPGAVGPFSFVAGPGNSIPTTTCVSTGGTSPTGCTFDSKGMLYPGFDKENLPAGIKGVGAYCGSSQGVGTSTYTSGDGDLVIRASFGWRQSAATILPLEGTVSDTDPEGGESGTVVGFTSSRGTSGGNQNCRVSVITDQFQVEGMVVTF